MTDILIKKGGGIWTHNSLRENDVKTHGEEDRLQVKGGSLEEMLPSQPTEGTKDANTLTSDF